jgi:hypothetical protein
VAPNVTVGEGYDLRPPCVVGNPERVVKAVNDLECPPGCFERPYTWPRYEM